MSSKLILLRVQIMYAFIMRPETLPKPYREFIQKTGPVASPVYQAVRECCRGGPIDVASLSAYISSKNKASDVKVEEFASIIPCSAIHPNTNSCLAQNANAMSATFKKTFPLYFSLTFVPYVVLHLQKVRLSLKLYCFSLLESYCFLLYSDIICCFLMPSYTFSSWLLLTRHLGMQSEIQFDRLPSCLLLLGFFR